MTVLMRPRFSVADIRERQLELAGDRILHVLGHELEAAIERVTGLERPLDDVDRLGHLFFELRHALGALAQHAQIRQQQSHRGGHRGDLP